MSQLKTTMVWLARYADSIRNTYGVDPRVFIALFLGSIPPFYLALAVAIRRLVVLRRSGRRALADRSFVVASTTVVIAWLIPYAYVALFGRLPWWAWILFAGLLVAAGARLVLSGRRRAIETSIRKKEKDDQDSQL